MAEDKDGHAINLELEALKIGKISPSVTVEKTGEREIPFSGKRSPAFGAELFDLSYNPEENRIELEMQRDAIKLCRDQEPIRAMVSSAFIVVE